MKKPISKTSAFVSGISTGGRRNLPQISDRLMAEVRRASKNEFVPFKRAVKDLLIDVGEYKLRSAVQSILVGGRLKTDIATVSRDGLGFDDTGLVKIVSEFQSRPIAQYSPNRESICVKRHRYKLHLNKQPAGKFKTLPHGYRKVKRVLFDTKSDCQRVEDRLDLTTKSGFNESIVDVMSRDSTATMEDFFLLTNCAKIIEEEKEALKAKTRRNKSIISAKEGGFKQSLAAQQLAEIGKARVYAKILKMRTRLEVHSDVTGYVTYVRVHLVCHKKYTQCDGKRSALTADELFEGILDDVGNDLNRSLRKKQILKSFERRVKGRQFKRTMLVEPGSQVLKTQVLRDNITVLKSFNFILKPSELGIIDLTHNFTRGLDLKDLSKATDNEAAATTFFIIEASGDKNARVTSKNFEEVKINGISPISLRYEFKREMEWISKEEECDVPATLRIQQKENLFEDVDISELFYPTRVDSKNIPLELLEINRDNKKAEFRLDMDNRTNLATTLIDSAQESTKKNWLDLEDAIEFRDMVARSNKSMSRMLEPESETMLDGEDIVTDTDDIFDANVDSDIIDFDID